MLPVIAAVAAVAAGGLILKQALDSADTESKPSKTAERHGTTPMRYADPAQPALTAEHVHRRSSVEMVRKMLF